MNRLGWEHGVFFGRGNNFQIIVGFIDLYSEAEGLWSNPLIRFNPIHGRAVGLFIRYGLLTHLIRGGPIS
jgi:hypothetical protein